MSSIEWEQCNRGKAVYYESRLPNGYEVQISAGVVYVGVDYDWVEMTCEDLKEILNKAKELGYVKEGDTS